MTKVPLDFDFEVVEDIEIDVEVNYRCWFSPTRCFYPMAVSGSICKGEKLSDFKRDGLEDYNKDYQKVEVVDVFIGID